MTRFDDAVEAAAKAIDKLAEDVDVPSLAYWHGRVEFARAAIDVYLDEMGQGLAEVIDSEAATYEPVTDSDYHHLHEPLTLAGGSDMPVQVARAVAAYMKGETA